MVNRLEELVEENIRLTNLVQLDGLTGLYNRKTAEEKINTLLELNKDGVLLVIDADEFKQINDHFGHLMGDYVLQSIASTLTRIFRIDDLIARIGGDEFIVFLPHSTPPELIDKRMDSINKRLCNGHCPVHVSYGYTFYKAHDSYASLFERADKDLLKTKSQKHKEVRNKRASIQKDLRIIQKDLKEKEPTLGAFYQPYELFKAIFRFTERNLISSKTSSYMMLLTLRGHLEQTKQEEYMKLLFRTIKENTKNSDVFTQYSNRQYILMLPKTDSVGAKKVGLCIHEKFKNFVHSEPNSYLSVTMHPMKSIEKLNKETVAKSNKETVAKSNKETIAKLNKETVAKLNKETVAK
jgi:diguanylate cyclase (GGDEF)-like protein